MGFINYMTTRGAQTLQLSTCFGYIDTFFSRAPTEWLSNYDSEKSFCFYSTHLNNRYQRVNLGFSSEPVKSYTGSGNAWGSSIPYFFFSRTLMELTFCRPLLKSQLTKERELQLTGVSNLYKVSISYYMSSFLVQFTTKLSSQAFSVIPMSDTVDFMVSVRSNRSCYWWTILGRSVTP